MTSEFKRALYKHVAQTPEAIRLTERFLTGEISALEWKWEMQNQKKLWEKFSEQRIAFLNQQQEGETPWGA
jgi:hypothetical protein